VSAAAPARVLAVLDDASVAAALIEASCALAQLVHRELQLVYVESAAALAAAELSATRVLAQGARAWAPLAPEDVERGWRAQAARLRTLAERATTQRTVRWSMRVTRGALRQTVLALRDETDLLLVAAAPARLALAEAPSRRAGIAALDDGSAAGHEAVALAGRLARALGAPLRVFKIDGQPALPPLGAARLVVAPASRLAAPAVAALRVPLLLVGTPA
jgi:hypothetical protein